MTSVSALLNSYSLEMTGRDIDDLIAAADLIPAGTRVNVTFLGTEDLPLRLAAVAAVQRAGLVPVPHISARRLKAQAELEEYLGALRDAGAAEHVFVVGGDPHTPEGPYASALDVIRTGLLPQYGVETVSISGYPEGHPDISDDELWAALRGKSDALREQGLGGSIITQFGFAEEPILAWIERVRGLDIDLPVRIGVPGPAGVKRLLGFARRFGIASSAGIVKKYGFSLTNLMGTAGPDRLISALAGGYEPERHGDVMLHFYTFGGVGATATWVREFGASASSD
jgi:methylenetetrahydrofolate reductase (NADPH)